jgi:hypothetical protein
VERPGVVAREVTPIWETLPAELGKVALGRYKLPRTCPRRLHPPSECRGSWQGAEMSAKRGLAQLEAGHAVKASIVDIESGSGIHARCLE